MSKQKSIFTETDVVQSMNDRTDVVEALLNGTYAITASNEKSGSNRSLTSLAEYIPKEVKETKRDYANRLARTYVTPYFANAIDSATGQIFKTPPQINENKPLDDYLKNIITYDVDMEGTDITEFSIEAMKKSMAYGMSLTVAYFYNPTGSKNLGAQKKSGARPYVKNISPRDLLGYTVGDNGKVTMIRYLEDALVDDEIYGSSTVKRVRRVTPTEYQIYETDADGKDQIVEKGEIYRVDPYTNTRVTDRVPMEILYGRKISTLNARSVFEDLAWINVHHTQVNSDLTWSSHFSLIPFLAAYLAPEVDPSEFDFGFLSSQLIAKLPKDSKMEWVETSGKPQEVGFNHLEKIEDKIQISTMSSSVGVTGSKETATGRAIDANSTSAKLRSHSEALESWVSRVIDLLASYMIGIDAPDVEVTANKEFDILINAEEIKLIQEDLANKVIDKSTYLAEMKRRGIYRETVNLEDINEGKAQDVEDDKTSEPEGNFETDIVVEEDSATQEE